MRDSVPSGSYSSVCNVLRQWKSRSSLLIESIDSMIESTDSMIESTDSMILSYIIFLIFRSIYIAGVIIIIEAAEKRN